jgi:hypothetical protein
MANKVITLELNDKQQQLFDEWCSHLTALYGEIGLLTWNITPNGIGNGIEVYKKSPRFYVCLSYVYF